MKPQNEIRPSGLAPPSPILNEPTRPADTVMEHRDSMNFRKEVPGHLCLKWYQNSKRFSSNRYAPPMAPGHHCDAI